jgi:peptidoglycan DL-endopeptidase CwlO
MKKRIVYMYENGSASMLELLLSSEDLAQFLNRAENIAQISQYDRDMLAKYKALQADIKAQEEQAEEEAQNINELLAEKSAKQQEVQALTASTNENIQSYIYQISASQDEISALNTQISNADSSIYSLLQAAEAEKAAKEAQAAQEAEAAAQSPDDGGNYGTEESYNDYSESESDSNQDADDSSESSDSSSEGGSSSSQGTYLGTFTLTAYCNCAQCCGTAGNLTASGTVPTAGRTVAMAGVPFGTQLLINGNVYTVEDLGTPYGHVDIYFNSHSEALAFGLQSAEVYRLN